MCHGFVRDAAVTYQTIDGPGCKETRLAGINTTGDLAGSCSFSVSFVRKRDGFFTYLEATLI